MTDTPDTKAREHANIATALAAAQIEMGPALKSATNPHFNRKYADLASVMAACLPALNANGIAVLQPTSDDESGRYVETIFIHGKSGESLKCRVPLIVNKADMQGYGSAVTYARRYGLMGMAGVAPEDDDGAAAAKSPPPAQQRQHHDNTTPSGHRAPADIAIQSLKDADTLDQLAAIWTDLPQALRHIPEVQGTKDLRKAELAGVPDDNPFQ